MKENDIQYLERKDIDINKWNNCVAQNHNGLVYAYSFYLDAMAVNWNAIVVNDYNTIMPLPLRRKYGINYHFKPAFIQQLGIIGDTSLIQPDTFIEKIMGRIKYGTVLFNFSNENIALKLKAQSHTNMIVDLSLGYDELFAAFGSSVKNHIRQSRSKELRYSACDDIDGAIELYIKNYSQRIPSINKDDYRNLNLVCKEMIKSNMCLVRKVTDNNNNLVAITLLLRDNKRIYNLLQSATSEGRSLKANYFLLDNLFKEFSSQPLLFDFEGSDLEGVKEFYSKFGSHNEAYFYLNYNRLPWPLNLLKK